MRVTDDMIETGSRETWAGWLGRRTADALFFWLCLWLAHWMGVVVFVNCGGGR